MKFSGFFRFLGVGGTAVRPPVPYDPVYGLPKSAIDAWLAHNPELRSQHALKLRQRRGVK
jgi:hypothetical protein